MSLDPDRFAKALCQAQLPPGSSYTLWNALPPQTKAGFCAIAAAVIAAQGDPCDPYRAGQVYRREKGPRENGPPIEIVVELGSSPWETHAWAMGWHAESNAQALEHWREQHEKDQAELEALRKALDSWTARAIEAEAAQKRAETGAAEAAAVAEFWHALRDQEFASSISAPGLYREGRDRVDAASVRLRELKIDPKTWKPTP